MWSLALSARPRCGPERDARSRPRVLLKAARSRPFGRDITTRRAGETRLCPAAQMSPRVVPNPLGTVGS